MMCRSKNDPCGARRCPTKSVVETATAVLAEYKAEIEETPSLAADVKAGTVEVGRLKERVSALKERIVNGPSEPSQFEAFDREVELELQTVGAEFVSLVDDVVEFSEDDMFEVLDERLGEVFEAPQLLEEAEHELSLTREGSEEWVRLSERVELLKDMANDEEKHLKLVEREVFGKVAESYREAYIKVLSSIRPLGSDEASATLEDGYGSLREQLNRTVFAHYPTEWLERHTAAGEMVIGGNGSAVHYNGSSPADNSERLERIRNFKTITAGDEEGRQFLKDNVLCHYDIVADGTRERSDGSRKLLVYDLPEEELGSFDKADKPSGEGWEYRTSMTHVLSSGYDTEEAFIEAATAKRWVRASDTEQPVEAKLNFYSPADIETLGDEHTSAVLYHEFGHRMEHVLPDNILPRMEKAFLLRRSGKTEQTQHERLVRNIITEEYYHRADFVDNYVGRDYFTGESYEVFSTGVEALLGKKFSGLIGLDADNPRRDEDHRRFTLGVLATL